MHHPQQFNLMAKSLQDDRLRAAAANRAGRQARGTRINRRLGFGWLPQGREIRWTTGRAIGWVVESFGHLTLSVSRAAQKVK